MKRVAASFVVVLASCLFPDLGELAGGDASTESGSDASAEAAADAGDAAPGDPGLILAHAGAVTASSGNAQQAHVVWARVTKAWWLFYIDDDTTKIKTRWSPDFKTWTDAASLALPYTNASDGRSFSVAYANLGGADLVHITASHVVSSSQRKHTHTRAMITAGAIAFGAVNDVSSLGSTEVGLDPDSPSAATNGGGRVYDATGNTYFYADAGVGNANVYVSQNVDDGVSWTFGFTKDNLEQVAQFVNARQILAPGVSCSPVYFWEKADLEPDPTNVRASCKSSGVWWSPVDAFASSAAQDPNDWCAAFLDADSKSHVVRATLGGTFQHATFDVGVSQISSAPPSLARRGRTGLVLLSDSLALTLVDLGADDMIHAVKFSSGAWDTSWKTVDAFAHTRSALSGASVDVADQPQSGGAAIIWTQPSSSGGSDIAGMLL